ncbi:MAG: FecR domain-containing protein, partial [Spirochaetia bacterium]|nr:FecR domain-containing protein [Spirochaetia bacterium]
MEKSTFDESVSRYLLGDMKETERNQFIDDVQKSHHHWNQFQEYLLIDDLLTETLRPEASEHKKTQSGIIPFPDRKKIFYSGIFSAGIAAVFIFSFFLISSRPEVRVYTAAGECLSAEGNDAKTIISGKNSICDIFFEDGRDLKVRLFPDSKISLSRNKTTAVIHLEKGLLLSRTMNNRKDREKVFLILGKTSLEYLGTQVTAYRKDSEYSRIEVTEGSVQLTQHEKEYRKENSLIQFIETKTVNSGIKDSIIQTEESATILENRIKKENLPEDRLIKLKENYTVMEETWSGENNKDQSALKLQDQIQNRNFPEPFSFHIHLKNGDVVKGTSVYHEGREMVIETGEKTLRFKSE